MRRTLVTLSCFAVLAMPLSLAPAYAQQSNTAPSAAPQAGANSGEWNENRLERQEFREERERIRAEHDRLESEHDSLKMQCMDAKGQDRSECHEKMETLRMRQKALHDRMMNLHERAEAVNAGKHTHHADAKKREEWKQKHQAIKNHAKKPAQDAAPASTAPTSAPADSQ